MLYKPDHVKHVALLISGQPSTNPRTVKEYVALKNAGFKVTVLYAYATEWAVDGDKQLFRDYSMNPDDFILLGGSPHSKKLVYYFSRVIHRLARALSRRLPFLSGVAESRVYLFAINAVTRIKADLYVAHAASMMPVAIKGAKQSGTKAAVDFEDFFSGQWKPGTAYFARSAYLEKKYLSQINCCTAASPMIAEAYEKRFGLKPIVINNVFSLKDQQKPSADDGQEELKLFWFSQTVGRNRGLQEVIAAIGAMPRKTVRLSIMGKCPSPIRQLLEETAKQHRVESWQLSFIEPQPLDKIFSIAGQHHIGLALEVENTENRKICLTNKLFTYLLSGLAVIATDTPAQKAFIREHSSVGFCYPAGDHLALRSLLRKFMDEKDILARCRQSALDLACEEYNWEKESQKFISYVNKCLD